MLLIIFLITILSSVILLIILHTFELLPKKFMRLLCKFPSWHIPDGSRKFDGCTNYSKCKYCKHEIMQDGQGNWYIGGGCK